MKYVKIKFVLLIILSIVATTLSAQLPSDQLTKSHWGYDGHEGPAHWAEIDPGYSTCNGSYQSPINIVSNQCENKNKPLDFCYHPFYVDLINNGHTLIENIIEPKSMSFDGVEYSLLQFHFHTPSEHHVNGEEYPMEIHFVHQSEKGEFAVIAILVNYSHNESPFLSQFMNSIPHHINEEIKTNETALPTDAFPEHTERFFYYEGSLTTPPCTEGIHWIVFEEPIEATMEQIETIHEVIKDDNRPIQQVGSRTVFHAVGQSL